ncbi:GGDEF domain-containing protein [Lysinibacillus sp. RSDA_15]|uniref:Signaling membrane protein n=3 Tax=Lysinibacillus TaxID=400634 RepID=W7RW03_LYSSH|nr:MULTISPECIES: GGDEF domain-containing protein [Lysinibacillus]MBG9726175.1 signaling membrane protein [Lysinibacillus fusiformis]AMO31278.1 signaling protein [Lysinibacillus sphaericus]AMR89614.1 signaling protein [Lysinibacillus sphaericus]ANA47685.1 signaling protein [Lysinibacillus sphaericus]EWH30221.1 signaling membrane protein [Lysinibacillus sphaericus CBAM5]
MGKFKLKLSFLIVSMTIMVVLATSSVSIWSSYQSFNEILMENQRVMQDTYVKESSAMKDGYLEGLLKEEATNEKVIPFSLFLKKVIVPIILVIAVVLVLAIWLVLKIVRPLNELSTMIEAGENGQEKEQIADWYYEAKILKRSVQNMMICAESKITDLTEQLNVDSLTGIPNRRIMDQTLHELIINKVPHAVILIDLDDFKSINDTYGHTVGDEVLKAFAHHMQLNMGEQGMCFRYGGEEFMIILPSRSIDEAVELAESLRVKQALQETACGRPVTMSAGITAFTPNVQSPNQLIEIADHALYKAKQSGRNCLCVVRNMRQMIIKS